MFGVSTPLFGPRFSRQVLVGVSDPQEIALFQLLEIEQLILGVADRSG
jgi:hypothetical protein